MSFTPVTWKSINPSDNSGIFRAMNEADAQATAARQSMIDAISGFKDNRQEANTDQMTAELLAANNDSVATNDIISKYSQMGFAPSSESLLNARTKVMDLATAQQALDQATQMQPHVVEKAGHSANLTEQQANLAGHQGDYWQSRVTGQNIDNQYTPFKNILEIQRDILNAQNQRIENTFLPYEKGSELATQQLNRMGLRIDHNGEIINQWGDIIRTNTEYMDHIRKNREFNNEMVSFNNDTYQAQLEANTTRENLDRQNWFNTARNQYRDRINAAKTAEEQMAIAQDFVRAGQQKGISVDLLNQQIDSTLADVYSGNDFRSYSIGRLNDALGDDGKLDEVGSESRAFVRQVREKAKSLFPRNESAQKQYANSVFNASNFTRHEDNRVKQANLLWNEANAQLKLYDSFGTAGINIADIAASVGKPVEELREMPFFGSDLYSELKNGVKSTISDLGFEPNNAYHQKLKAMFEQNIMREAIVDPLGRNEIGIAGRDPKFTSFETTYGIDLKNWDKVNKAHLLQKMTGFSSPAEFETELKRLEGIRSKSKHTPAYK